MGGIDRMANLGNIRQDPLYGMASAFMGNSLGSVPQIGGIQDFLGAQLDPNTQMRAPVPGYAPAPGQQPAIPGGGGGQASPGIINQLAQAQGGKPDFARAPGGSPMGQMMGGPMGQMPGQLNGLTSQMQNLISQLVAAVMGGGKPDFARAPGGAPISSRIPLRRPTGRKSFLNTGSKRK